MSRIGLFVAGIVGVAAASGTQSRTEMDVHPVGIAAIDSWK